MCGIFFAKTEKEIDINNVLRALNRRGPDMGGYFRTGDMHFFHQRLSILDVSHHGVQPMFDKERENIILFNGEIYNFKQLKKRLKGHNFFSNTDTEVVLELYKKYNSKMLNMIDGMFSILIYNFKKKELFVARDPLGIKPLYYFPKRFSVNGSIVFSSNIKALIESKIIPKLFLNPSSIKEFMCFRQNFNGKTLFKNIFEFLPGHYMKMSNGRRQYIRYWNLPNGKVKINKNKILSLFKESIKKRLLSDVPVGAFLSGGLDSSFLVSIVKLQQPIIHTIDARILTKTKGEAKFAKRVAKHLQTKHKYSLLLAFNYISKMDELIDFYQYPLTVPNEVAIAQMSNVLKKNKIGVVLSGEGADELFGGYDRIMEGKDIPSYKRQKDFTQKYNYFKGLKIAGTSLKHFNKGTYKQNIYKFFLLEHLRGLLKRLDNATMFHGLEGRVPFLDIKLVEYVSQIPVEKRYKKTILKDLALPFLPLRIIKRKKVGFPMPLEQIFDLNETKRLLQKGRLQKYVPIKELNKALKNKENIGYKIWMIHNMERFLEAIEK